MAKVARRRNWWVRLGDEALLDLRFCDLGLTIEKSPLVPAIRRLDKELERRGFRFRPHMWLAQEWFCPDGVPGFAIPFYLAHPRLARLERRLMHEVEGGNQRWRINLQIHHKQAVIGCGLPGTICLYPLHGARHQREFFIRGNLKIGRRAE